MLCETFTEQDIYNLIIEKQNDVNFFEVKIDSSIKFEGGVYPDVIKKFLRENGKNPEGKRRIALENALSKRNFNNFKKICIVCLTLCNKSRKALEHPFVEHFICEKCYVSNLCIHSRIMNIIKS